MNYGAVKCQNSKFHVPSMKSLDVVYEGIGVVGRGSRCVVAFFPVFSLLTSFGLHCYCSSPFLSSLSLSPFPFVLLWACTSHVALSATPQAASFGLLLLSFSVAQTTSFVPICVLGPFTCRDRIDVHCVGIPFGWPIWLMSRWITTTVLSGHKES
jgi:hypothetical protein